MGRRRLDLRAILGPLELCPAPSAAAMEAWPWQPHSLQGVRCSSLSGKPLKPPLTQRGLDSLYYFLVGQPGADPRTDPLRSLRPRDQSLPTSFVHNALSRREVHTQPTRSASIRSRLRANTPRPLEQPCLSRSLEDYGYIIHEPQPWKPSCVTSRHPA